MLDITRSGREISGAAWVDDGGRPLRHRSRVADEPSRSSGRRRCVLASH